MAFWGASQSVPSYLETEIVDPSQSEMCATLRKNNIFLLLDDGFWNYVCKICSGYCIKALICALLQEKCPLI